MRDKYIVSTITESRFGALFFGGSNVSTSKLEDKLNEMDADNYEMVFMVIEKVRNMIFWKRERIVLTFKLKC